MPRSVPAALAAAVAALLAGCQTLLLVGGFPPPAVEVRGVLPIELAYREERNLVLLSGRLNDAVDLDIVLDTGAPVTVLIANDTLSPLALDTSRARRLGPAGEPGAPTGVVVQDLALALGDVTLRGLSAVLLPEATLACPERFRAMRLGGVIGADLFRRFVVEVDPERRRVVLHDPAHWRVPAGAAVLPLDLRRGHPFVVATLLPPSGERLARRLHLDTGMTHALALPDRDAGARPLPAGTGAPPVTTCYVGGLRETRLGAALDVDLGGVRIANVQPALGSADAMSDLQRGGALGGGLLARLRYVVDYPGERLVLPGPPTPP